MDERVGTALSLLRQPIRSHRAEVFLSPFQFRASCVLTVLCALIMLFLSFPAHKWNTPC